MPNYYLYIPFTEDQNNFDLTMKAHSWRHHMAKSAKPYKTPTIICHGKNKINPGNINPVIYILGHGVLTEHLKKYPYLQEHICNTNSLIDDPVLFLEASAVAARIKADGLLPSMNAKIKLFFCNNSKNAKKLAESFRVGLGHEFQHSQTTIDYYDAILEGPFEPKKGITYKRAHTFITDSSGKESLVCLGRASEYRGRLFTNASDAKATATATLKTVGMPTSGSMQEPINTPAASASVAPAPTPAPVSTPGPAPVPMRKAPALK